MGGVGWVRWAWAERRPTSTPSTPSASDLDAYRGQVLDVFGSTWILVGPLRSAESRGDRP